MCAPSHTLNHALSFIDHVPTVVVVSWEPNVLQWIVKADLLHLCRGGFKPWRALNFEKERDVRYKRYVTKSNIIYSCSSYFYGFVCCRYSCINGLCWRACSMIAHAFEFSRVELLCVADFANNSDLRSTIWPNKWPTIFEGIVAGKFVVVSFLSALYAVSKEDYNMLMLLWYNKV